MTPAERQVLERAKSSLLDLMMLAAKALTDVHALLKEDTDVRPKPGPPR